jgi:acyl carrier protein
MSWIPRDKERHALDQRLAAVFDRTFGYNRGRFSLNTTPEDVPNWDSIGHMTLVSQLETEFGVQFDVDEIMEMSSAARIAEILKTKGVPE